MPPETVRSHGWRSPSDTGMCRKERVSGGIPPQAAPAPMLQATCCRCGAKRQGSSVTGPFLVVDLVPDVVLAGRLVHRNAFFFFQRIRVVNNDGTVVVPDAQQQLLAMAIKLHMGGYLAWLRLQGLDDFQS